MTGFNENLAAFGICPVFGSTPHNLTIEDRDSADSVFYPLALVLSFFSKNTVKYI